MGTLNNMRKTDFNKLMKAVQQGAEILKEKKRTKKETLQTINPQELAKQISYLKPIFSKSSPLIESSCIFFLEDRLVAFDDLLYISVPNPTEIRGVMKARELFSFLNSTKEESISFKQDSNKCTFIGKSFKLSFNLFDLDLVEIDKFDGKLKPLSVGFGQTISVCASIVDSASIRPANACVNVTKIFAESTDNLRIMRNQFDEEQKLSFLMPYKIAIKLGDYNFSGVAETDNRVFLIDKENDIELSFSKIEDQFPQTEELLEFDGTKIEFPDDFIDTLNNNMLFLGKNKILQIHVKDGKLTCKSSNEAGVVESISEVKSPSDCDFLISYDFLLSMLKYDKTLIVSDDKIKLYKDGLVFVSVLAEEEDL